MAIGVEELKINERPWRQGGCCSVDSEGPSSIPPSADDVQVLKALADETRLAIVQMLAQHEEPLCVCHIVDAFDLSQPTISHHLKQLREAGLIGAEKRGLWAYYTLNKPKLQALAGTLGTAACC